MNVKFFSVSLLIVFALLSVFKVNAQYCYGVPFVIADKDGYTNIREEPSAKSKIVGRVNKYVVFSSMEGCEDVEVSPPSNPWLSVLGYDSNNKEYIGGYIFKKNIIPLHKLLFLGGMPIDDSGHSITVSNDSIDATVNVIFYDNIIVNERKGQNAKKDFYGVYYDDPSPHKMLEKIIINDKGVQTVINKEQLQSYYFDIHHISIAVGFDGEFYIGIYGSGDENRYDAWFTIVAGKLVNEYVITSCW